MARLTIEIKDHCQNVSIDFNLCAKNSIFYHFFVRKCVPMVDLSYQKLIYIIDFWCPKSTKTINFWCQNLRTIVDFGCQKSTKISHFWCRNLQESAISGARNPHSGNSHLYQNFIPQKLSQTIVLTCWDHHLDLLGAIMVLCVQILKDGGDVELSPLLQSRQTKFLNTKSAMNIHQHNFNRVHRVLRIENSYVASLNL